MKNKILSIIFFIFILSGFILNLVIEDKEVSYSERRKLAKFPKVDIKSIMDGDFTDDFEAYTLDQFVFRDEFRNIKTNIEFKIFNKQDNNGIFIKDKYIYKMDYKLNVKSVNSFVKKMNNLYENYLKGMNVYYSIIPDKNYYLESSYLKFDFDELYKIVNNGLNDMTYIDITDCLNLDSYYYTDTHWKQEKLDKVVSRLASNMNFSYSNNYKTKTYKPFYGVYYGQLGLQVEADTLYYLTNNIIDNATVYDYDSDLTTVYEEKSLGLMDSYDVFLSGATPFVTITNPLNKNGKELVIFRDSYGSSLAPLLIEGYSKITLIDLRYMASSNIKDLIELNNQDVLILYSTLLINSSDVIRN